MTGETVGDWADPLEHAEPEDQWVMLCFLAGREVVLDAAEANAAVRRAELLLAAGGDPLRKLDLYGRAVSAVAQDLDAPERREQLAAGLAALGPETARLPAAAEALGRLRGELDLAWQCFAATVLAEALGQTGESESAQSL